MSGPSSLNSQSATGPTSGDGAPSADQTSSAFELLHEKVRWWVWRQGWTELRDIQEKSIPILLDGRRDLIISATTASGKTEAAFLPIVSRLALDNLPSGSGFQALYISPLRALINDQFGRMETLCEEVGISVTKWHGDVSSSIKARARTLPQGIILTTPESLEAMLVLRGNEAGRLFSALSYIVVDEMHAFMDNERGRQLQSLLNRVEIAAGRRIARIALSATLADMRTSAAFLRPLDQENVEILKSEGGGQETRLQVRGYIEPIMDRNRLDDEVQPPQTAMSGIIEHMFQTLRGKRSLIFAGSRRNVELVTAELTGLCEELAVPNEFFAHHGSLSRDHREEVERRLKDGSLPGSIVATTTLELGIDIGSIEAVAQLGPGYTVSGMRQRLGRSGRRAGQHSAMRVYVSEMALDEKSSALDAMRSNTVQSIAMLNLMLQRWNEPTHPGRLHLSTLVHQILALIAQHGGLTAAQGWSRLVESGVFPQINKSLYMQVLRRMGDSEVGLIEQASDGTLLPGKEGERVIGHYSFYAVFMTPEEFKIITDKGRTLGTIPVDNPVVPDQLIIFAGRRWKVLSLDTRRKEILVTAARGGRPPKFPGEGLPPADEVVAEMRRVYEGISVPKFLDEVAIGLLTEARETFDRLDLRHHCLREDGGHLLLFPWLGGRAQMALILSLTKAGIPAHSSGIAITLAADLKQRLVDALKALAQGSAPDAVELAHLVPDMVRAKYDCYLGDDLLALDYASERIEADRVPSIAADLLSRM